MAKVGDVLKFRDGGPSVDEARRKMLEAKEAPAGLASETKKNAAAGVTAAVDVLEPEFPAVEASVVVEGSVVSTVPVTVVPTIPAAVPPAVPPAVPDKPKVERFENDKFTGEIRQEGGKWVAEIQYKNGAGTERWTAGTKNELMLDLLKGKGNATLRVKEATRREKLGGPHLDKAYPLPEDMMAEEFTEMTEKQQGIVIEAIAAQQAVLFRDRNPEYVVTEKNGQALDTFLREHNLPYTVRNLEYAFEDLKENELLEKRPEAVASTVVATPAAIPSTEDSVAGSAVPAAVSTAAATPAAPVATVRKRGASSLLPGQSSVPSDGLDGSDTGDKPRDLSEAELRKLPLAELKRIATADRRARSTTQR